MFVQLQYAIKDMKNSWKTFGSMFVQFVVSMMIFALALNQLLSINTFRRTLESLNSYKNIYLMRDVTQDDYFNENIIGAEDGMDRLEKLYGFLHDEEILYTFSQYESLIYSNMFREKTLAEEVSPGGEYIYFQGLHVDANFLSLFGIEAELGRLFEERDYVSDDEKVSVVLGAAYQPFLQVGDMFGDNMQVVGFLPKEAFYIAPKSSGEVLFLEKVVLLPINMNLDVDVTDYDVAINSTAIITENRADLDKLQAYSDQLGLYTWRFVSYKTQLDAIVNETMRIIQIVAVLLALILFVCII